MKRKVLQVVGGMDRGGLETWLMHVFRHIDRDEFQIDFLVHRDREGAYDSEIRSLAGRIYFGGDPAHPIAYGRRVRRILDEHGPYDVVHSHVYWYSGYVLRIAHRAG